MIRSAAVGIFISILASCSAMAGSAARAGSQGAASGLAVCRAMKNDSDRLKCYDRLPLIKSIESGPSASVKVPTDRNVIAKWSSASDMQTRPFHANGPWELQWNTSKGYFAATLHRLSGNGARLALLANGTEGGSSSSYQPAGGDFYIEFVAMQPWSAQVASVPPIAGSDTHAQSEEPLLDVSGDQSGLPPCDGPGAAKEIKQLVEKSPLGQMMHISVLHVGAITSRPIKDGMSTCTVDLITNGGDAAYDFQYYRKDGDTYVYARPHQD